MRASELIRAQIQSDPVISFVTIRFLSRLNDTNIYPSQNSQNRKQDQKFSVCPIFSEMSVIAVSYFIRRLTALSYSASHDESFYPVKIITSEFIISRIIFVTQRILLYQAQKYHGYAFHHLL